MVEELWEKEYGGMEKNNVIHVHIISCSFIVLKKSNIN
jgi:hypothetical protein